jgi:hypothetical protein
MPDRRTFLQGSGLTAAAAALAAQADPAMAARPFQLPAAEGAPWWKGQLHAHANPQLTGPYVHLPRSSPDEVIRWYQTHRYQFAVAQIGLNYHTPTGGLKALFDLPGEFLVVPSEEVSRIPDGLAPDGIAAKGRILDMLALGTSGPAPQNVIPETGATPRIIAAEIEAIEDVGGLPVTAHPNLGYSVTVQDIIRGWGDHRVRFFEVWNAEPGINNRGGGDKPSTEEIWDAVLSTGRVMYALASDDSFHYNPGFPEHVSKDLHRLALPGQTSVMVRASELSWPALRRAMEAGDFYATTGITVLDYRVTSGKIEIALDTTDQSPGWYLPQGPNPTLYTTRFIGKDGKVLKEDRSANPSYKLKSGDLYARARVEDSNGRVAWMQPVFG